MPKKRKNLKTKHQDALKAKTPHGKDALYKTNPINVQPTSAMGVRMDDTWVSQLQVSGRFKKIGYQVVDEIVKDHEQ